MYKVAICEDNQDQKKYIKELIEKLEIPDIQEIDTFDSGETLVEAYKRGNQYSIILLDMQMDELNGIETGEIIQRYDKNVIIIIVTSILEYAVDGYSINAFDFILKPINEMKFQKILYKAIEQLKKRINRVYKISKRDKTELLKLSEIIYFESDRKKVKIHCLDRIVSNNESISEVEESIEKYNFMRISRFYLINLAYIKEIRSNDIVLSNGEILRYSSKLQKNIKKSYMNFMMGDI